MVNDAEFKTDDLIIYGASGVCLVKDICVPDINWIDTTKKYYKLEQVYNKGNIIYSPVDNSKTVMRKILSKEETEELIMQIPSIKTFWVEDRKMREEECKKALSTYNCYELVRIIKTLYLGKEAQVRQKKAVSQVDTRYLNMAADLLHGELAFPLEMPKEQVEGYIIEQVRRLESE